MIALQDSAPGRELQGQSLNLTSKEKLSEEDVQLTSIGFLAVL